MRKDSIVINLSKGCKIVLDLKVELSRLFPNLPLLHLQTPKYLVKSSTNSLPHLEVHTSKISLITQHQQT